MRKSFNAALSGSKHCRTQRTQSKRKLPPYDELPLTFEEATRRCKCKCVCSHLLKYIIFFQIPFVVLKSKFFDRKNEIGVRVFSFTWYDAFNLIKTEKSRRDSYLRIAQTDITRIIKPKWNKKESIREYCIKSHQHNTHQQTKIKEETILCQQ